MFLALLRSMRPRHWVKNGFVFPALIFSKHLFAWSHFSLVLGAAGCFCILSGVVYLINDVADVDRDRLHPQKSRRPIAAGELKVSIALSAAGLLLIAGLCAAFWLHSHFGVVALIYALVNFAYSFGLKRVVLIDVLMVASGFLLRALGGAVVIQVPISPWFILCAFTLALFLAVVKRRQELVTLEAGAGEHRAILEEYPLPFLDQIISILTSATLVCYALYAMGVGDEKGAVHREMQWTIPLVLYGILRYLYLVYRRGGGDNPTAVVWSDRPLQVTLLLWLVVSILGYYELL
jgi:4-hydroxybenzoate polyprenyltransferase